MDEGVLVRDSQCSPRTDWRGGFEVQGSESRCEGHGSFFRGQEIRVRVRCSVHPRHYCPQGSFDPAGLREVRRATMKSILEFFFGWVYQSVSVDKADLEFSARAIVSRIRTMDERDLPFEEKTRAKRRQMAELYDLPPVKESRPLSKKEQEKAKEKVARMERERQFQASLALHRKLSLAISLKELRRSGSRSGKKLTAYQWRRKMRRAEAKGRAKYVAKAEVKKLHPSLYSWTM